MKKYVVDCWIPVPMDEIPMSLEDAMDEKDNLELMQPDNIYEIREVTE